MSSLCHNTAAAQCVFYRHETLSDSWRVATCTSLQQLANLVFAIWRTDVFPFTSHALPLPPGISRPVRPFHQHHYTAPHPTLAEGVQRSSLLATPLSTVSSVIHATENPRNYCHPTLNASASDTTPSQHRGHLSLHGKEASKLSVRFLHPGGAVSMMASCAQYDEILTRCHCIDYMTTEHAASVWPRAVRFVAEELFVSFYNNSTPFRTSRNFVAAVRGVFLQCVGAGNFSLGVVVEGTPTDPAVHSVASDLAVLLSRQFNRLNTQVPIGERLRRVSLRLWWPPRSERIVPYQRLTPVKVILEDAKDVDGNTSGPLDPFKGYLAVRLFVCRPAGAHLLGVETQHSIPRMGVPTCLGVCPWALYHLAGFDDQCQEPTPSPLEATQTQPYDSSQNSTSTILGDFSNQPQRCNSPAMSEMKATAVQWGLSDHGRLTLRTVPPTHVLGEDGLPPYSRERAVVRTHLYFCNFALTTPGEHLLGVETLVEDNFRHFIPTLTEHLSPFRVVDNGAIGAWVHPRRSS